MKGHQEGEMTSSFVLSLNHSPSCLQILNENVCKKSFPLPFLLIYLILYFILIFFSLVLFSFQLLLNLGVIMILAETNRRVRNFLSVESVCRLRTSNLFTFLYSWINVTHFCFVYFVCSSLRFFLFSFWFWTTHSHLPIHDFHLLPTILPTIPPLFSSVFPFLLSVLPFFLCLQPSASSFSST